MFLTGLQIILVTPVNNSLSKPFVLEAKFFVYEALDSVVIYHAAAASVDCTRFSDLNILSIFFF